MTKSKIQIENELLKELQDVSEEISDHISNRKFDKIILLEKQRLKILKSFHIKPSDSGMKLFQNILEKNKKNIDIIDKEKFKLNKNFKKVKKTFLAYGK